MARWMVVFAWVGCAAKESQTCLEAFPESEGYGFTGDGGGTAVGPSGTGTPPTLDDFRAACESDGATECETVVTREAALCIADDDGLPTEGRTANLVYNSAYRAIIWGVQAVDHETGATSGGPGLSIHAETGEILERWSWERMP